MTLHPQNEFSIPEETVRVARAAYPKGNLSLKMRDALGTIYQDQSFAQLFPQNGRPVEAPWRLAFITVVQFLEGFPDRQAAEAMRGRIDRKYALGLKLTDSGFDFTILSDFRTRLIDGEGNSCCEIHRTHRYGAPCLKTKGPKHQLQSIRKAVFKRSKRAHLI